MLHDLMAFFQAQLNNLHLSFTWLDVGEVLIIVITVLAFYKRFIKNTQSEKLIRGILFLIFAWIVSEILIDIDLNILGMFIRSMVALVALSLIVIFQPELRRFLGYLGQPGFISKAIWGQGNNKNTEKIDVVKEVIEAVKYLSKSRIGALIVFQKEISASSYFDVGTKLNADVTTELILTIFHPNTPLHDGAMVIKDNKILSAGVLLPLTEDPKLSWKYGTRHRAAIGMSEVSDSACLVVSEETGDVSMSMDGTLKKYEDLTSLKADLENILGYEEEEQIIKKSIFNINNLMVLKKEDEVKKESEGMR
ncbi:MAG: diadenylate cyclase CdaA [Candidatus Gastranaerophilales bacterium]|nr:diadenylate cyclase CdaA [Candidatus Gastranaerophilales bacterium]